MARAMSLLVAVFLMLLVASGLVDPEAYGAAMVDSTVTADAYDVMFRSAGPLLQDHYPLAIGVEIVGGAMVQLIPRGATSPTKKKHVFTTYWDKQTTVSLKVFQGEAHTAKDKGFFDSQLDLSGLPPPSMWNWRRRQIEVTMKIDDHDNLHVDAIDLGSGTLAKTIFYKGRLSPEEIDQMLREAEEEKNKARDKLSSYVPTVANVIVDRKLVLKGKGTVEEALRSMREWLELNPVAEEFDYKVKLWELKNFCDPIMSVVPQRPNDVHAEF